MGENIPSDFKLRLELYKALKYHKVKYFKDVLSGISNCSPNFVSEWAFDFDLYTIQMRRYNLPSFFGNYLSKKDNGQKLVHLAAKTGKREMVDLCIQHGADVTVLDQNGQSVLYQCIFEAKAPTPITDLVLDNKNLTSSYHGVLRCIIQGNVQDLQKMILEEKIEDINFSHLQGESPLSFAVVMNKLNVVKMLLQEYGANVNRAHPRPLLHDAIRSHCDVEILNLLLEHGADPHEYFKDDNHPNTSFNSLLVACRYSNNIEVFKTIFNIPNISSRPLNSLFNQRTVFYYTLENQYTTKILKELLINKKKIRDLGILNLMSDLFESCSRCDANHVNCNRLLVVAKLGIEIRDCVRHRNWPMVLTQHGMNYPCPMIAYLKKLRLLNCDLGGSIIRMLQRLENRHYYKPDKYGTLEEWNSEIEKLKGVIINWSSRTTLFDFILMKGERISRYAKNRVMQEIWTEGGKMGFKREYPYFGWFVNNRYRAALKKSELMESSKIVLETVIGSRLNEELNDLIFENLSSDFLEMLNVGEL